jgi:2-polyprenyl-3-methyl-5-hydroxy-6-metoxy-1,4-benzoquinol methylase
MLNNGIKEINEINKEFYKAHNTSFANSRKDNYWEGFSKALNFIKTDSSILDLGCGNGRFYEFLKQKNLKNEYLGIDNSIEFINQNKISFPEASFEVVDIINDISKISEEYDFVAVFGVTHHIPSKEFRKTWFESLGKTVSKNGYLFISFWNFDTSKADLNFKPEKYQIENGDYFLGWKSDFKNHRYCHLFTTEEILETATYLKNFEIISNFDLDSNKYLVLKRID